MSHTAIIVAAGRGTRMGGDGPKQYAMLRGKPVLWHTVQVFLQTPRITAVQVVIHADDTALYENAVTTITDSRLRPALIGGDTRSASVKNGLAVCTSEYVLIHDAARPFLSQDALTRVIDAVEAKGAAFLALPSTDALWQVAGDTALTALPRDQFFRGQTPQAFQTDALMAAYETLTQPMDDDVAVARAAGIPVHVVTGEEHNFKLTHPADMQRAQQMMGTGMDIRTGNGFDVHKFGDGDHVVLCGVKIPHTHGLVGHSDADVGMHALTDAIFGALAEGDIGQWFPPSDPQWKGAASDIFLTKAVERTAERGFTITHLDCTLICEQPKIGPHCIQMRETLADITGIEADRISVKATTSEQLGFTGRKEGIAALASATLVAT